MLHLNTFPSILRFIICQVITAYGKLKSQTFMHQSIPAVPMPPLSPGQPWGICSRCQPGSGAFANFIAARGLGISVPQGSPRAFDTRVFERWMSLLGSRYQKGRKSQSLPPKCINLRAKRYIVFILNKECSHSKKRKTVPSCRNDGTS